MLDLIVLANSKENKIEILDETRSKLEQFRIHLRLAYDLRILNIKRYEYFNRMLEEISKQLSGWQEWSKKKQG